MPREKGKITNLNISGKSLEGSLDLSDFTSLENLDCSNNKLTGITGLSSKLTSFRCSSNQLTNLEINNCEELTNFWCLYNQLTELKITNCPKLSTIDCDTNKLESLDVGDLSGLTSLDCRNNLLTSITLPKETANLKTLYLQNNKFSKDKDFSFLTSFTNLETLNLGENEQFALYNDSIDVWREWKNRDLGDQEVKKIKEAGVGMNDYQFADYLNKENYKVSSANKEELEKKYKDYRQVQTWIDFNYPEEERSEKTDLDISNKNLEEKSKELN